MSVNTIEIGSLPLPDSSLEKPTCITCFQQFVDQRRAMVLSCGHSICSVCVKNVMNCPLCNSPIQPNSPKVNYALMELTTNIDKKLTKLQITSTKCHDCQNVFPDPRMHICADCNLNSGKNVVENTDLCGIIVCSDCVLKNHINHKRFGLEQEKNKKRVMELIVQTKKLAMENHFRDKMNNYVEMLEIDADIFLSISDPFESCKLFKAFLITHHSFLKVFEQMSLLQNDMNIMTERKVKVQSKFKTLTAQVSVVEKADSEWSSIIVFFIGCAIAVLIKFLFKI